VNEFEKEIHLGGWAIAAGPEETETANLGEFAAETAATRAGQSRSSCGP